MGPELPWVLRLLVPGKDGAAKQCQDELYLLTDLSDRSCWVPLPLISRVPQGTVIESYRKLIKLGLLQEKMNVHRTFFVGIHPAALSHHDADKDRLVQRWWTAAKSLLGARMPCRRQTISAETSEAAWEVFLEPSMSWMRNQTANKVQWPS